MNRLFMRAFIALLTFLVAAPNLDAHDAWLSARWGAKKTHIVIAPVVAETFPAGEPIKDMKRFVEPSVYFLDGRKMPLSGSPTDSTILGSVPIASTCIAVSGIKQREITYNDSIARLYLTEEIGLPEDSVEKLLTPGVKEYSETYGRHLKTVVTTGDAVPKDSLLGMPVEIVLVSWDASKDNQANISFRLLTDGKPVAGCAARVLSNGKTTLLTTDSLGIGNATINTNQPALIAHIQIKKLNDTRLQSVWTNLAIYRLK